MALKAGDRLGAYEIVGLLGHGAMGEVYRARDTRLGRDVAVKVLPAAFAHDPDRLARLEREARLISQVNHPNICTLFDIFEGQSAPSLIFELIEGETLQQRLLRGPMPVREALRCAAGIASALEAAHAKGIIHRDLKPSNIKITAPGTIKVLDFGVAKLARDSGSEFGEPELTLTLGGTKEGVLVGTVAYVSPEQAMGDRVDGRSDIWAFGCLLYEMLTAKRAFPGVAVADTLGAVMRGEPDWAALPAEIPHALRTLLRRCLEKDRARRLADIADARLEIDDLLTVRTEPTPQIRRAPIPEAAPAKPHRGRSIVVLAFVAGVIVATVIARSSLIQRTDVEPSVAAPPTLSSRDAAPSGNTLVTPPKRESPPVPAPSSAPPLPPFINLPDGVSWARAVDDSVPNTILAMSPNGRLLVFSGRAGNVTALWLRSFTSEESWRLPGTDGGISPFWSPDSTSIGFFANRMLKRLDLNGLGANARDVSRVSAPLALAAVRSQRGGTWGPDNIIVFAPFPGGLKRISANGGEATPLTTLDRGEPHHVRPHFFPGTRRLLYRVSSGNGRNNSYYVTSLDTREKTLIATVDSGNVTYSRGHLLFIQSNTLMAQPFDVRAVTTTGAARPIASGVLQSPGAMPVFGVFSASQTGTLVYLSQGGDVNNPATVLSNWADRPIER
jgi:eukaryotic-like serine/threonine-protein kinase